MSARRQRLEAYHQLKTRLVRNGVQRIKQLLALPVFYNKKWLLISNQLFKKIFFYSYQWLTNGTRNTWDFMARAEWRLLVWFFSCLEEGAKAGASSISPMSRPRGKSLKERFMRSVDQGDLEGREGLCPHPAWKEDRNSTYIILQAQVLWHTAQPSSCCPCTGKN